MSARSVTRSSSTASELLQVRLVVDLGSGSGPKRNMMAWFASLAVELKRRAQISLSPDESEGGQALCNARCAGCAMKHLIVMIVVALAAWSTVSHAQPVPTPQEQSAPGAGPAPASDGLSDLEAMTFGCAKAALNAAAREAAKVPSQGTYQFAYFRIINDSHYASYEVHFKSNYRGETDLKYCVVIYCQQGWDPKTTKTSVTLMSNERQPMGGAAHGADCGHAQAPVKRRLK